MNDLPSYFRSQQEKEWCDKELNHFRCVSSLVEGILGHQAEYPHSNNEEFCHENIINGFEVRCAHCGEEVEDEKFYECWSCDSVLVNDDDFDHQDVEILEWWLVDYFWFRKLQEIGQPILEAHGLYFWGRKTSGQAIILDGVMQKVYRSLK